MMSGDISGGCQFKSLRMKRHFTCIIHCMKFAFVLEDQDLINFAEGDIDLVHRILRQLSCNIASFIRGKVDFALPLLYTIAFYGF